jgi:hypothetical protein
MEGVKVSWDDDIPFPTEWKNKSHVPNHQPANQPLSTLKIFP